MAEHDSSKEASKLPYSSATDVVHGEVTDVDPVKEKQLLLKVDRRILVCCLITYTLNFIDKTLLGYAAIFGIIQSTVGLQSVTRLEKQPLIARLKHLVGRQYSWASSIFYFGYMFWEYPTTILIQKLPIGKYLSASVTAWGVLVACSAACTSFAGLAATRFLLGALEATSVPSFVYLVSQWYTRDEAPLRTGTWFVGTDIGAIFAALIIYGLGHSNHSLEPWRWMFIVSDPSNAVVHRQGWTLLTQA